MENLNPIQALLKFTANPLGPKKTLIFSVSLNFGWRVHGPLNCMHSGQYVKKISFKMEFTNFGFFSVCHLDFFQIYSINLAFFSKWRPRKNLLHFYGCLRSSEGEIYKTSYLRLWLMPSPDGHNYSNENFGFGITSKIRLQSYSGKYKYSLE